ncbi:unnamed protein product [Adineta steineri]|uniref:Uncharacterized protein n=2 Tax=Adineta steineri TaxID=433720 RepID=A0A814RVT4_9BILA|nr:unnamed protein product [Adineta steineri]CAF3537870.1 unnamed protein product [Adineta steineri]
MKFIEIMFKLPDHTQSNIDQTSINNKYTSEFESEDIHVWTKFFDRSQILDENDRHRINHIFNKLVTSIVKYEREQDFQLLEALAKRVLSIDNDREENEEPFFSTIFDQERLIKLRTLCKRLKHYNSVEKLLSTMFIPDTSNELILPPINKTNHRTRISSLSFDDARISLPVKKKSRISVTQSPTSTETKPKQIMMHGPITLQNIYQALPAATLQFAEDEYVWHANRPVNMILATGVQLPNVLTEAATNTNIESEQFFSNMIEDIITEYQKRHPGDHYSALKQWRQKHNVDHYTESITPNRMNGFETLIDVVQRRHLGKLQRYFLNVVSTNRHFNPYDLITVPDNKVNPENHYVFSVFGILHVRQSGQDVEFLELAEWYRHAQLWHACQQIPFFRDYLVRKQFNLWLSNARFVRFARRRFEISEKHLLFIHNPIFQMAILEIRRVIHEYQRLTLLPQLFSGASLSFNDLETTVNEHTTDIIEYTKKFYNHIKTILNMTRETSGRKLHAILKCLNDDTLMFNTASASLYEQRIRKENLRKELEQMQNDIRKICPFLNLCSAMLASCLCYMQYETLSQFNLSNVTLLTTLYLSDTNSNHMLQYFPSRDDYLEILQLILHKPQQILEEQWRNILELNTCLRNTDKFGEIARHEGLTSQCEKCGQELYPGLQETSSNSCKCKKQQSKASTNESNDLLIKGHGFFGSTTRNEILPFELIFTKDAKYEDEIKNILSQVNLSFDELDSYCESNEWLCEIKTFCLQWTPNQMKQLSEGKQIFPIEEQLKLLRVWIDKTRTFELTFSTSISPYVIQMDCSVITENLYKAIHKINLDLGKYLYDYAFSNIDRFIKKFQHACEVFDRRPKALEDFSQYVSFLTSHKTELSSYQQDIDYLTTLYEIVSTHFGHLRQDNDEEPVHKQLIEIWKIFQEKLSDGANFIVQEILIVKENLREIFDKLLHECDILHDESTSGNFLDPTQDPLQMIKQLKKNSIQFENLAKQLKKYADWRILLAANSLNPLDTDQIDMNDMDDVNRWSMEIEYRKDLWKYVEITSTSIKEWKNTFLKKFNIPRAREKLECWLKIAEDFKEKISSDDPIVCYWIEMLTNFEQNIELLEKLLSDAMTGEQWRLLFRANGHDYDPQFNYRIQDLIDLNILRIENYDVFMQIHKHATKEQKLKEKLSQMQTWLNELYYRMIKYGSAHKTNSVQKRLTSSYRQRLNRYRDLRSRTSMNQENSPGTVLAKETSIGHDDEAYIMLNSQELLRLIEDRSLLLHTNEPFHIDMDNCREQFQQYYILFDDIKYITQTWYEIQNKWMFLRSALVNLNITNDDQTYLKDFYQKFINVDESFRTFQKFAFQNPSVAGLVKVEMNQKYFQNWLQIFDELIKEFEFYLNEQYRSKFHRFYFLTNHELITLISFGLDPRYYIPYVRQLFQGIHNIQFHLPEQSIGASTNQAINSAAIDIYAYRLEGVSISNINNEELSLISKLKLSLPSVDTTGLNTHIISSQSLTKWFRSLENSMKHSLRKYIFHLLDKKINEQLDNIFCEQTTNNFNENEYPLQVTSIVEHILFNTILEKQIEKKSKLFIRKIKLQIEEKINQLIQNKNKQQNSLIIQQLYFRDVLTKLIDLEDNLTLNSYEWLSLIKYEINLNARTHKKINFLQFSNRIYYNFEYMEPSSTFIISPLMERTLFQLTQAICNYRIGVVHAPPQYGRSSSIHTLAQLCGTNFVSVSCNSVTEVEQIKNFHQGLITSNNWCLFKDIHRLSTDCLSSLAIAMRYIRMQLEERQTLFNNSYQSLKRSKSQSDLVNSSSSSLQISQDKIYSNEYPMIKKIDDDYTFIIDTNQEILQYPLTYGVFATFDDYYQPLSSTIKFECRTISISRPDFKILAQSLLYINRLFTIEEYENWSKTAQNLVDFLECSQLVFDEMKCFYSPYILLRSIIEQSTNMSIKQAIITIFKQHHLYDSNIQKIIEKFFNENSNEINENDNELCFVDNLKQEAYDNKITFDDDDIFNNASRLMNAVKRNDFIFIIGQCGSAKSSLIRLVERTMNKQMSLTNTNSNEQQKTIVPYTIFPNSFDEDQFYQTKNSFIEQWKQYYTITHANDTNSEEYWIIFDIDSHTNWLTCEKIQYLYKELLSSVSRQNGSIKFIIECDSLPNDFSHKNSIFDQSYTLNLNKFQSRTKLIQSAVTNLELKLHFRDSTLSSIQDFINDIIEPYIEYIEKEHICQSYINNLTDSFIKILLAFIEQHVIDVQNHHHALDYVFAYCFIWAYVHPIHPKYEQQVTLFVRELLKSYNFPSINCKLTDLYPDMAATPSACFIPVQLWLKTHDITYNCIPEFEGAMRLMSILVTYNYPIGIYSNEQGLGKTTLMKNLLTNISHVRLISTGERKSILRDELYKYNLPLLSLGKITQGTKFVLWFEDVKDEDVDLIRSLIDEYSTSKQQSLNIVLTGQSYYSYSSRFSRHFIPIIIQEPISTLISSIYSITVKDWLEEFPVDAINHPIELAHACLLTLEEIFEFLKENFKKIQWNLHHVDAIINGMFLLEAKAKRNGGGKSNKELNKITPRFNKKKQGEQIAIIIRLLCHEISRVILDRLTNTNDRILFQEFLYKTIIANFCTELEFHVTPNNSFDSNQNFPDNSSTTNPSTVVKKQVKFKLNSSIERAAIPPLEGPIISFGKIIGIPKLKDPSKIPDTEVIIEKLTMSTYFSKQIPSMHTSFTGEKDLNTNLYQELNDIQMNTALQSCQSHMGKLTHMDLAFLPRTCRHIANLVRVFSLPQNGHALLRTNHIGLGRQDLVQLSAYIAGQQFFDAHSYIPNIDENQSVKQCLRSCCLLAGLKQKNIVVLVRENFLSDEMIKQLYVFTCEGIYPGLYSNEELIRIAAALSPGLPTNRRVTKTSSVLRTFYGRIRKRLHLIILENDRHLQHKGLLSSCYVDEYSNWTKEEITSIAKYWMAKKVNVIHTMEPTSSFDLACQALADIYLSMEHFRLFTLKNIRKTIEIFFKFYQTIHEKESFHLSRCESMLNRTNKSKQVIQMNEELCVELQNEIDILQEILSELDNELKIRKKNFSLAVDDCREEEKLLNEMLTALERLRKDVEAAVADANPQYENALNALKQLNKADYDEIRTFRQPPQPVLAVMNTICIMFHRKPEWSEAKILMTKDDFFDDLIFYDKDNVSDEVFDMLTKIVSFDTFRPSFVKTASKAASSLCAWILAVYEYAKVARAQKTLREQVKAYEELYNKRQQILGEKRLYAEKLKDELAEYIRKRRAHFNDLQSKQKRLNNLRSVIDQTQSMLKLIANDISHWQDQLQQGKLNKKTVITDALLISLYFCYLSQFNIDQRQQLLINWQTNILQNILPIRANFNLLDIITDEKELNDYLLKHETRTMNDKNSILNAIILANQLDTTFVLFIDNPENDILLWNDLLISLKDLNGERANHEIELYYEYKQNASNNSSATSRGTNSLDQSQVYSRINSSKTSVTVLTEKSSVWGSSASASRAATSTLISKPVGKVTLNDDEKSKYSITIPEFSLEDYQRPPNNIIYLSGKQTDDFDKELLTAMFFGNIVIINECDLLNLNPFVYRFIYWSSRRDQYSRAFPNLYRFGDQDIFINSSFRLILNYYQIDHNQWNNLLLKNRLIDMSLNLNKLESDFWLRLIELRCQKDFIKQVGSNHRRQLISLNEQYQRRENLTDLLEIKENLTIDSTELLSALNNSNEERISIESCLNEYRIQYNVLCTRTGSEAYKEISRQLAQLYILLRDSIIELKISLNWFLQLLTNNLPRRIEITTNTDPSNYSSDMINKIQARETYLRCFESIYSYLLSSMSNEQLEYFLTIFALITQDNIENIYLFKFILKKLNPQHQQIIPDFLDDKNRPLFINKYSWSLCLSNDISKKYSNLSQHLIDYDYEWKEYLFSTNKLDFMNKSPYEKSITLTIIDRFILSIILLPNKIPDLIHTFLIYHYGGLLRDKSLSSIDDVYQLTSSKILNPTNNIILVWTSSSAFIDPIDEIRRLAYEMNQSIRLVSSIEKKRLNRFVESEKDCWLIITNIDLFNDDLQQIQDFLLTSNEKKIWLICDPLYQTKVPHWLIQRCLQVYLSDSTQSALYFRLQQKLSSFENFKKLHKQIEPILHIHTYMISKKIFPNNFTENNFFIDLKHCFDTNQTNMIDYTNYIQNEDEHTLIHYLKQSSDPSSLVKILPDPLQLPTNKLFITFQCLFNSMILPTELVYSTKDDEMILVEPIVRNYLTYLHSIDSDQCLDSTCSSIMDLFILIEYRLLQKLQNNLCKQMEHLVEVFDNIEIPSSNTNSSIRSILYDSNSTINDFVANCGLALKNLSKNTSNNINLRFIRRRKQFIQLMRLQQNENLIFHLKYNEKSQRKNNLSMSGIHLTKNTNKKDVIICLDKISLNDSPVMTSITLATNENNIPTYLPVINSDKNNTSELILLSIDKPHI